LQVADGSCRLADGTLAGTTLPLLEGVIRLAGWGAPVDQAIAAATLHPRRVLGDHRPLQSLLRGRSLATCLRWRQEPTGLIWRPAA
jgi:N-acetylglucosamine-6-phosphate deacetylase